MANKNVILKISKKELLIGSYVKVPVIIETSSGLTLDDLDFDIPAGSKGGIVSLSRDTEFDPSNPDIILCIGYKPGRYILRALRKGTTTVLSKSEFVITDIWKDKQIGPSKWFAGINKVLYPLGAPAWGGGPEGPQNMNTHPAIGNRRIAILLIDTASQRFTNDAATLQGHRDRWLNEIVNGVVTDGVARSSAHYYREVSYGNFDLTAEVFGPVNLTGNWDDYFDSDGVPNNTYFQACFSAGDNVINYNNFDTLLCVSQSVDRTDTTPGRMAWPYASIGGWGPFTTAEGSITRGVISMPNEWGVNDNREIHETFSHELGHNLGLTDQYKPVVPMGTTQVRNIGGWDIMHLDDPLPHFCLTHRMMLGWVQANQLRTYNFTRAGRPIDETVELHPVERHDNPPAGRHRGIEIRIADGWNYYFEYRVGQANHIGDRNLPLNDRVLGNDVDSPPVEAPIERPEVLLLNNDEDNDGSILGNGQDYKETDYTDPVYPTPFIVDVSSIDGTRSNVRIRYGPNGKPDPSIRPWPAGPGREWQSPDIEIQNARNQADPKWFNVPWIGRENTIIANVRNNGNLDAPAVRVNFYVLDFNVSGSNAPETFLGSDVRAIPAGATVTFTTRWTPPRLGHYCVRVRIPLYETGGMPSVVEMTELNNLAQSNYNKFISNMKSPASREITTVEIINPYNKPTQLFLSAGQTNPLYRTFIEHTSLMLKPGERRKVKLMFEYVGNTSGDPIILTGEEIEEYPSKPNDVGVTAFIQDPEDRNIHTAEVLGGAQVQIETGRSTEFKEFRVDGEIHGAIVTIDDGQRVPSGKVILTFSLKDEDKKKYVTAEIRRGEFSLGLPNNWQSVIAYYLAPPGYANSESKRVFNEITFSL
jgi:M6 family metalloprotease-like protein